MFKVQKFSPPVKTKEDERKQKIDSSLEDIIYQKKKKTDDQDEWRGGDDYDDDYKLRDDKNVHYVTLHLPRSEIQKICDSLNIDTKGYYVKMEAVLTKRNRH